MRGGERSSGGVPEQDHQSDETHRHEAADGPYVASMTSRNVPERMNELGDPPVQHHDGEQRRVHIGDPGLVP
jgi:hypothetical protein